MTKPDQMFIVLGSSGWVGHYFVQALRALRPEAEILAIHGQTKPVFTADKNMRVVQAGRNYSALLSLLPAATIIHLGRGETENDFLQHRALVALQRQRNARYLYASSFNAVDADISRAHFEGDPPAAKSDYGKFKARCELELLSHSRGLAFRFAATHGWAPNREARTQELLRKLRGGEEVKAPLGILQNRSYVGELATQIALLACDEGAEGVFHLGTADFSEELVFLRKLAAAFGYDPSLVHEDGRMDCNAVMVMERLRERFPDYRLPSESETIKAVAAQPELAEYRRR